MFWMSLLQDARRIWRHSCDVGLVRYSWKVLQERKGVQDCPERHLEAEKRSRKERKFGNCRVKDNDDISISVIEGKLIILRNTILSGNSARHTHTHTTHLV